VGGGAERHGEQPAGATGTFQYSGWQKTEKRTQPAPGRLVKIGRRALLIVGGTVEQRTGRGPGVALMVNNELILLRTCSMGMA